MENPSYQDIQNVRQELSDVAFRHWLNDDVFSPTWWLLLASTIIPVYIWYKVVDKKRFFEILSYGLITACLSIVLDVIGVDLTRWGYPDKLFSMIPPLFPADLVVIPISAMLVYQYFNRWSSFLIANTLWASTFAYIIEPLAIKIHMFHMDNWKHTYSFIGFFILGISVRCIILYLLRKLKKNHILD